MNSFFGASVAEASIALQWEGCPEPQALQIYELPVPSTVISRLPAFTENEWLLISRITFFMYICTLEGLAWHGLLGEHSLPLSLETQDHRGASNDLWSGKLPLYESLKYYREYLAFFSPPFFSFFKINLTPEGQCHFFSEPGPWGSLETVPWESYFGLWDGVSERWHSYGGCLPRSGDKWVCLEEGGQQVIIVQCDRGLIRDEQRALGDSFVIKKPSWFDTQGLCAIILSLTHIKSVHFISQSYKPFYYIYTHQFFYSEISFNSVL